MAVECKRLFEPAAFGAVDVGLAALGPVDPVGIVHRGVAAQVDDGGVRHAAELEVLLGQDCCLVLAGLALEREREAVVDGAPDREHLDLDRGSGDRLFQLELQQAAGLAQQLDLLAVRLGVADAELAVHLVLVRGLHHEQRPRPHGLLEDQAHPRPDALAVRLPDPALRVLELAVQALLALLAVVEDRRGLADRQEVFPGAGPERQVAQFAAARLRLGVGVRQDLDLDENEVAGVQLDRNRVLARREEFGVDAHVDLLEGVGVAEVPEVLETLVLDLEQAELQVGFLPVVLERHGLVPVDRDVDRDGRVRAESDAAEAELRVALEPERARELGRHVDDAPLLRVREGGAVLLDDVQLPVRLAEAEHADGRLEHAREEVVLRDDLERQRGALPLQVHERDAAVAERVVDGVDLAHLQLVELVLLEPHLLRAVLPRRHELRVEVVLHRAHADRAPQVGLRPREPVSRAAVLEPVGDHVVSVDAQVAAVVGVELEGVVARLRDPDEAVEADAEVELVDLPDRRLVDPGVVDGVLVLLDVRAPEVRRVLDPGVDPVAFERRGLARQTRAVRPLPRLVALFDFGFGVGDRAFVAVDLRGRGLEDRLEFVGSLDVRAHFRLGGRQYVDLALQVAVLVVDGRLGLLGVVVLADFRGDPAGPDVHFPQEGLFHVVSRRFDLLDGHGVEALRNLGLAFRVDGLAVEIPVCLRIARTVAGFEVDGLLSFQSTVRVVYICSKFENM